MKSKINIVIVLMLSTLLVSPMISGFMLGNTHKLININAVKNPTDSDAYQSAIEYPKIFYSGNVLTDISVFFYYTARSKYSATHSPNFCRSMLQNAGTDEERACAWGSCAHQPADIVSHNKFVPKAILNSLLVNNIVHVFAEQKLDNWVAKNYPHIEEQAMAELNDYETCVPLFIDVLVGDPQYSDITRGELESMFTDFVAEVQNSETGYDTAFKAKSFLGSLDSVPFTILGIYVFIMLGFLLLSILLGLKIYKKDRRIRIWVGLIIFIPLTIIMIYLFIGLLQGSAFNNFITVIKPISNLVPIGGNQEYIDEATSNTIQLLTQGEQWLSDTEADGFTALDNADSQILIYDYIILIMLVLTLAWFIWFIFKKNKIKLEADFKL